MAVACTTPAPAAPSAATPPAALALTLGVLPVVESGAPAGSSAEPKEDTRCALFCTWPGALAAWAMGLRVAVAAGSDTERLAMAANGGMWRAWPEAAAAVGEVAPTTAGETVMGWCGVVVADL